jgi:hypothetical protein
MKAALLIGLNYTGTRFQLHGCINDVMNMRSLLIANEYLDENITILIDSNSAQLPTRANILAQIQALINNTSITELFILYSGHGSQVRDTNGDERGGRDSVIVPCDFQQNGFIVDDTLITMIKNITCKCLLLFDSCNSGTVCDLPFSYNYVKNNIFSLKKNKYINISNQNIYMMSGCRDNQYSQDCYVNGVYGGAFTNAFIKKFTSTKTMFTLYADICKSLPSSQQPVFSSSSLAFPQAKNQLFSLSRMIFH